MLSSRRRKEKAVELAGSIIALTLGEDVEMTIIVHEPGGDDGDVTLRSSINTAEDLAKLLYRMADHFAAQNTAPKGRW
jgi:hypothetical protein